MDTTKIIYTNENGEYKEERKKEHNRIIKEMFEKSVPNKENPAAIFIGGGSGSGKSTMKNSVLKNFHTEEIVVIDADEIKKKLPEYEYLMKYDREKMSDILHDESSYLAKKIAQMCLEDKRDFLWDKTLSGKGKELEFITELAKNDFLIIVYMIDVPLEVAYKRNAERERVVNEKVVEHIHKNVPKTFHMIKNKTDITELLDNREEIDELTEDKGPVLVYTYEKGIGETIHNWEYLKEFYEKGEMVETFEKTFRKHEKTKKMNKELDF